MRLEPGFGNHSIPLHGEGGDEHAAPLENVRLDGTMRHT